ncbi:alpha/beta fold hydrolase [Palleronia caenipelagi]|uniref:Alpha/beta fold hydrolase n=1 Tax=Palleronia caenipelagi TaxID=2489174 RepID=A0A547Q754_9RHOB|nr:alpha/beta fold hydrolase [Palleronia caenipelagi]TRD22204.1 alpha/beta fold hydrolase [Palleronia caenipelagi]
MSQLAYVDYESGGDAPPLLIAHGLFGSARNWNVIAKRLSDRGPVRVVDMRNHGDSPHLDNHDYPSMADDLAAVMDPGWDVLGHSMGGKAAMMLALAQPDLPRRIIVADIAPVSYSHSQTHLIDAMRRVDLSHVRKRRDAEAQLADHVDDPSLRSFLLQSLDPENQRWKLNLDALERHHDLVIGWPEVTGQFERPALFLTGGASDYVTREMRPAIRAHFAKARFTSLPDAGHWLHAEKPRDFEATMRVFLDA